MTEASPVFDIHVSQILSDASPAVVVPPTGASVPVSSTEVSPPSEAFVPVSVPVDNTSGPVILLQKINLVLLPPPRVILLRVLSSTGLAELKILRNSQNRLSMFLNRRQASLGSRFHMRCLKEGPRLILII